MTKVSDDRRWRLHDTWSLMVLLLLLLLLLHQAGDAA